MILKLDKKRKTISIFFPLDPSIRPLGDCEICLNTYNSLFINGMVPKTNTKLLTTKKQLQNPKLTPLQSSITK